jgi:deazaflavin-dependent oxidoreductase (nitroreductase family)
MNAFMKIGNFFVKVLLRSPLHGMLSKNTLILSYAGRKSGKPYSTPTNYSQDGNTIRIVSFKDRVWWRNLRGGVPVSLQFRGKSLPGRAEVLSEEHSVAEGLKAYLKPVPDLARYFDVRLNEDGMLNAEDISQAAKKRVIVEVTIEE